MNSINWFEIPATDIELAAKFYSSVLGERLEVTEFAGTKMATIGKGGNGHVHGALVHGDGYSPCRDGAVVYLNGGKDLNEPLARVSQSGGTVTVPKTRIGDYGYIAMFIDSEGNRVAFHSPN